ncbi:hypothetical protein JCM24511_03529 [Saitozyma sp. JCM 24511]|nr:hypothetical protein JCM24511_03529 [Saitozyma sp. JCM 24511]
MSSDNDTSSSASSSSSSSSTLSSINSQLLTHGWAKRPLNLDALSEKQHNDVVSVLFELLGASVTNLETLDDLSARHRTLNYEYERLGKALASSKVAQGRMETEVNGWKIRVAELEKRLVAEESKTKELREEVNRGRKAVEAVRIAAGHEAKKNQIKLEAAQARLTRLSSENVQSKQQGLCLLNPIAPSRSAPLAAGESSLLEQSLRDLAVVREGLQEESDAFRHVIVSAANGLRDILAVAAGRDAPPRMHETQFFSPLFAPSRSARSSQTYTHQSASSTSHPSIADARLRSLLAETRTKMAEKIVHVQQDLVGQAVQVESPEEVEARKRAEREDEKRRMDEQDRVKDLEVELVCARGREEEAKRTLEEFVKAHMQGSARRTNDEVQEDIDMHDLARKKVALDDERRKMAHATLRLEQERRQLELERQMFEDERRKADVDALLALVPLASENETSDFATSSASSPPTVSVSPPGPEAPTVPVPARWAAHRPHSPSPLSPHKLKTPKSHTAGKRRMKTPLSRLVLEKAVRQQSQVTQNAVLGESGRRSNLAQTTASSKGKEKATASALVKPAAEAAGAAGMKSSTRVAPIKSHAAGASGAAGLNKSVTATKKADLAKSSGIGSAAASKGQRQWR